MPIAIHEACRGNARQERGGLTCLCHKRRCRQATMVTAGARKRPLINDV